MRVVVELTLRRALLLLVAGALVVALALAYRSDHTHIAEPPRDLAGKPAAFPLHVEPGKHYLIDKNGVPFLVHGDAPWSIIAQGTRADAERYFEDRRRRGVNLALVNLLEHFFSDHPPRNVFGEPPFRVPADYATVNPAYFDHAREIVRIAANKGIAVLLCASYLGGDGGDEGFYAEMRQSGPDKLFAYGEYIGARFREFDNVIWLAGGDYTPPAADLGLVDAVMRGIKQASPAQLMTGHFSPEISALEVKLATTTFDFNTTYTYHPAYLKSLADYAHGAGTTHVLIESKYELDRDATQRWVRAQAYYALLTGAAGHIYGHRYVYPFTTPTWWRRLLGTNWVSALDSPGARSMGHVKYFFARLPWTTLVPDERWEVLTSGQGWKGSLEYPVLAWSPDGALAVTYAPHDPVTIDLDKLKKPLRARWYDPTSGTFEDVPGTPLSGSGRTTFTQPGLNSARERDWVLLLEAVK